MIADLKWDLLNHKGGNVENFCKEKSNISTIILISVEKCNGLFHYYLHMK